MSWTDEIVVRLKELADQRFSAIEISQRLNREFGTSFTRNAVIGKANRLQLKNQTNSAWTDKIIVKFRELAALRFSATEISQKLNAEFKTNFTRNAVLGKAHRVKPKIKIHSEVKQSKKRRRKPSLPLTKKVSEKIFNQLVPPPIDEKPIVITLATESGGIDIMALKEHSCRWIISGESEKPVRYCGRNKMKHSSYCEEHHGTAYTTKQTYLKQRGYR